MQQSSWLLKFRVFATFASLLMTISIAVMTTTAKAQTINGRAASWRTKKTQPSRTITMRIADPFADPEQEKSLLRFLQEPYTFQWKESTTLLEVTSDLSSRIPFHLDVRSLEEIGLASDLTLPHAFTTASKKGDASNVPDGGPAVLPWWRKSETTSTKSSNRATNAAVLFQILDEFDMTIQYRFGQWRLTTIEIAEMRPSTRLYDVTTLVSASVGKVDHGPKGSSRVLRDDSLIEVIETSIDPDTWETLGGPSSIQIHTIGNRHWLILSTMITTHWKAHALLNQLAQPW